MQSVSMRLMPLLCFNCGMPVNNRQQTFDALLAEGYKPVEIFEKLGVTSMCCRAVLSTAPDDTRLKRVLPKPTSFVQIHHASKLQTAPYTLYANGHTDPVPASIVAELGSCSAAT